MNGPGSLERDLRTWLHRSLDGDPNSYVLFLERVAKLVRGFVSNRIGQGKLSSEGIDELVQDVLLSIHEKRHTYERTLPVLPWVFAIARHRMIDRFRAGRRAAGTVPLDKELEGSLSVPEQTAITAELTESFATLTPRQREVLWMAKAEGFSMQEIGERTGLSLSAVKVTIHRAIAALRKWREEQEAHGEGKR